MLRIVQGGTLRLTAKGDGGLGVSGSWLWMSACTSAGSHGIDSIQFERGVTRWIGAGGDGERVLAPGPYQIQVLGDGFAHELHTFEINSGKETHLDLLLRRGIQRTLVIENTAPESPRAPALLTVRDS